MKAITFFAASTSSRLCCSLTSLTHQESGNSEDPSAYKKDAVSAGVSVIPDVTITTDNYVMANSNGDCNHHRIQKFGGKTLNGNRLPPPMSLRKCVLIDSQCSLQKYSVLHLTNRNSATATTHCGNSAPMTAHCVKKQQNSVVTTKHHLASKISHN